MLLLLPGKILIRPCYCMCSNHKISKLIITGYPHEERRLKKNENRENKKGQERERERNQYKDKNKKTYKWKTSRTEIKIKKA